MWVGWLLWGSVVFVGLGDWWGLGGVGRVGWFLVDIVGWEEILELGGWRKVFGGRVGGWLLSFTTGYCHILLVSVTYYCFLSHSAVTTAA